MNLTYESWRKLYIRETGEFAALSWMARALAAMLLKYVDDRGRIFPRAGEDIRDAICERMGADRGERRMIKPAIDELLKDGHIVRIGSGVRIKNFVQAQGRTVSADTIANDLRTGDDSATTESPPVNDGATTTPPSCDEPSTTVERTSNEEPPKCAQTLRTDHDVPSVPSDPSVSTPDPPHAPVRDPSTAAPAPEPEHVRIEPDGPGNLIHALGVLVRASHPEVGLWSPGRFAEQDALRFYERIPKADLKTAPATIRARLEAYVGQPSDDGWTVKGFLDRFNELGQRRERAPPRGVTVGSMRAEGTNHPVGEQKI